MTMKRYVALACALLGFATAASSASAALISIACDSGATGKLCQESAEAWAAKTGNKIRIAPIPPSSEQLGIYQQFLAAKSSVVDVYTIDVVWTGVLSNYLVDLSEKAGPIVNDHYPAIIKNNTINGKLIAMPWYADAGLLYYRKDLLQKYGEKVPDTWEELAATAKRIQDAERKLRGGDKFWGFVWQGKASESLTCDALEWVASFNGGSVVDPSGKVTIDNPGAIKALTQVKSWVGTISPPDVLKFDEEASRGVFQSGNAVFMRNWPYAWGLANSDDSPVKDKVAVAALPRGGHDSRGAATLGGQQLAVSKYSKNVDAAIDLVLYLTSREEQRRRSIQGGFYPTIASLYKDKEMIAAHPFQADLYDVFVNATARPSSATKGKYTQVSSEFYNAVHTVLSGEKEPNTAVKDLDAKLKSLSNGGKW